MRRGPAVPRALATLYAAYGDLLDTRTWPRKVAMFRTGGNSGIGVETARALASAGAKVILTSRKAAAGEAVVASLKEAGVKASDQETIWQRQRRVLSKRGTFDANPGLCFNCI